MSVTGGWTYPGTWGLNLRDFIGGDSVQLTDSQVSAQLPRRLGVAYPVRIGAGSPFTPDFAFQWECTGDVSPLQVGTTVTFTPAVDALESTMDCVLVIDNTNPPTLTIDTVVEGDPTGLVEFDTTVEYDYFGTFEIDTYRSADGASRTFELVPGFGIDVSAVAAGATPADTRTSTSCFDAANNYNGGGGTSFSVSSPAAGSSVRCVVTHSVPATLIIVEDVVPDDPSAPAADYSKSPFTRLSGPDAWSLLDGESQSFVFGSGFGGGPSLTRTETPGWDATSLDCNRLLTGGATEPYSDFTFSPGSSSARATFPYPPAGFDIVCRFIVEPAGPPVLSLSIDPNVFDGATLSDFEVAVSGPFDIVFDTITIPAGGGSDSLELLAFAGNHTLQLNDAQGRDLFWTCDAVVSTTTRITFPTILGERIDCRLSVADPFPVGTASLTILKNEEPDNFDSYSIRVTQDDFVVGSGTIFDGGPGLFIDNLALGNYVITESGRNTDYELASVDCLLGTPSAIDRIAGVDPGPDGSSFRVGTFTLDTVTGNAPDADTVCTLVNSPSTTPAIVRIETVTVPAGDTQAFSYEIDPASLLTSGTANFTQVDGDIGSRGVDPGFVLIEQQPVAGFSTQWDCASTGSILNPTDGLEADLFISPGFDYTCQFVNTAAGAVNTFDLTLDVVVDTGVIDRSTGFDFLTNVSGPGVDGATTPGTSRTFDLGDGGSATVAVAAGTDVNIAEVDDLAGAGLFRTTIDCGASAPAVTNATSTFTITADTTCTVTYAARTLTVEKSLIALVTGGFDTFDFSVQPVADYSGDFSLSDADQTTLVVPLGETIELEELDAGPYGTDIACTVQTATGPTSPNTGPFEFGTFIQITDLTQSYFCEVSNFDAGPPVQEVIITSLIDLGTVTTPSDLPGFFVDLDGDFDIDGEFPQLEVQTRSAVDGPGSTSLSMVASSAKSALGRSEFLNANGTLSVFVADGSDLVIAAGSGSGRYANSFSCASGAVPGVGSVTITDITSTVRCDLTSAAGVLQVEQIVNGSTSVADWPFTITEVIAGDASVSLAAASSSLSAVAASRPLLVTLGDARGAQSVSRSCRDAGGSLLRFGVGSGAPSSPLQPALSVDAANSIAVTVPGGEVWSCTFTLNYADTSAPTTTIAPTTTAPTTTAPPATVPTTTVSTPTTTTVAATPTTSTPGATTTTTTPIFPFAPASPVTTTPGTTATSTTVAITSDAPPSTNVPGETPATTEPTTGSPTTEPPTTGTPTDEPADPQPDPIATPDPVITEIDAPEDIYVDIGDPIPVDVDCAGELVITVNGERQDRVDRIEPSTLGLGDHVINVACDGEQITSVRAVVFEQEESSPAGRNMTVIVMFVVMASAGFLFAPSAAGRKRLPA